MKIRSNMFVLFAVVFGMLSLTGCPPKKKLSIDEKKAEQQDQEEADKDAQDAAALDADTIKIAQDWTEIPALALAPFAYDSASLDDTGRSALRKNVAILKKLPKSVTVRVEGHCDDRGTIEYNIALGQRRANALRSYYITSGIAKGRIETISFGEERPLCGEQTDACLAQNRRGSTKVRNAQAISVKNSDLMK
ncbi:MAG: OmpA family protein [Elusimicrobiota bacterium]